MFVQTFKNWSKGCYSYEWKNYNYIIFSQRTSSSSGALALLVVKQVYARRILKCKCVVWRSSVLRENASKTRKLYNNYNPWGLTLLLFLIKIFLPIPPPTRTETSYLHQSWWPSPYGPSRYNFGSPLYVIQFKELSHLISRLSYNFSKGFTFRIFGEYLS